MSGFKRSRAQKKAAKQVQQDQEQGSSLLDTSSNDAILRQMTQTDASMQGGDMDNVDKGLETLGLGTGILANKVATKVGGQDKTNAPKSKKAKKSFRKAMLAKTAVDAAGFIPGVNQAGHMTAGVAANATARKAAGANKRQAMAGAVVDEGLAAIKGLIPIYGQIDAINGVVADLKALKDGIGDMPPDVAIKEYKARLDKLDELEKELALHCNEPDKLKQGEEVVAKQRERLRKAIEEAEGIRDERGADKDQLVDANDETQDWGGIFDEVDKDEDADGWETLDLEEDEEDLAQRYDPEMTGDLILGDELQTA